MSEMNTGRSEEIHQDDYGRSYERVELNGHWVEYRYLDEDGVQSHVIAFPRIPLISDETISELKALDDAQEDSSYPVPG